ncbi:hypothetical protein D3C72_2028390 [compost metagenome]
MVLLAHARQFGVVATLQSRVQRLVFHGQVQLDGGAHADDESCNTSGVLRHPSLRQTPQGRDVAHDVYVLVFELVNVHGMLRGRRDWPGETMHDRSGFGVLELTPLFKDS